MLVLGNFLTILMVSDKSFTGLLELMQLYKHNPLEKISIFTIYQNYTLALTIFRNNWSDTAPVYAHFVYSILIRWGCLVRTGSSFLIFGVPSVNPSFCTHSLNHIVFVYWFCHKATVETETHLTLTSVIQISHFVWDGTLFWCFSLLSRLSDMGIWKY